MLRKLFVLLAPLFFAIPVSAVGILSFSLNPTTIQTPPGGIFDPGCQNLATLECVIFTGEFSFSTEQDYFVNDIQVVMNPANPDGGADVMGDDNYFQFNVPGTFGSDGIAGGSYSGGLFEVDVAPNTPNGVYNGSATLEATNSLGLPLTSTQNFQVDVVPEPGMSTLMFAGLASLAVRRRRYRRK